MSLSDLSSVSSLVSGMAVLVSLVYLSLQVRQTERNQRALMNQGIITRVSDGIRWQAEPHMSGLVSRLTAGETEFTAQELIQLGLRLRNTLNNVQDTYVQHRAGLVDSLTFETSLHALRTALSQPVNRALWKSTREAIAPEWRTFVDGSMAELPLARPIDIVARFKSNLAEITQ
jgi:hypothetical protein